MLIHIAGDWLTDEGVPIPVVWIFGHRERLSVGLFGVNGIIERALIAPLLSIACIVLLCAHLGIHDVDSLVHWCGTQLQQLIPSPFARGA